MEMEITENSEADRPSLQPLSVVEKSDSNSGRMSFQEPYEYGSEAVSS